jgi:hypothetical protein
MSGALLFLRPRGASAMPCPSPEVLTLWAAQRDGSRVPDDDAAEVFDGWTAGSLRAHVDGCRACRRATDGWRAAMESWRSVDLVEQERFDDAYFARMEREVMERVDAAERGAPERAPSRFSEPRPRASWRPLAWGAALAASLLMAWLLAPHPKEPGASTAADAALPSPDAAADSAEALAAQARELGRALRGSMLQVSDSEDDFDLSAGLVPAHAADEDELSPLPFAETWLDELDELVDDGSASASL